MKESHRQHLEAESCAAFGLAGVRQRKTERYLRRLVHQRGEVLVRQVLHALWHCPDESGRREQDSSEPNVFTAPLETLLRPFRYPQYALSFLHVDEHQVLVDVSEGVPLAGSGVRYRLNRTAHGLRVEGAELLWVS